MKNPRVWTRILSLTVFFYLFSLLFTWPVSRLAGQSLTRYAGTSLWLERLKTGADSLFFSDYFPNAAVDWKLLPAIILPLAAAYFLLQLIGSAGVMKTLADLEMPAGQAFGSGVLNHGPRFLLLFLLFVPQYLIVGGVVAGLFALVHLALPENVSEMFPLGYGFCKYACVGLGLLLVQTVHYTARAELVLRANAVFRATLSAWRRGPRFIGSCFVRFLALTVVGGLAALALTALGWKVYRFYPLLLVFLQGAVFSLIGTRIIAHAFFIGRCRSLTAESAPAPEPTDAHPVEEVPATLTSPLEPEPAAPAPPLPDTLPVPDVPPEQPAATFF